MLRSNRPSPVETLHPPPPQRGRTAAQLCSAYVSFSGGTATTANEVITWADDKLLEEKKRDRLCHCSSPFALRVVFDDAFPQCIPLE